MSRDVIQAYHQQRMPPSQRRNPDAVRFGDLIARLRAERGWSLVEVASRAGMNDTYLGVMERGGNMPTLATIFKLAEVFDVEAADVVREIEKARKAPAIPRRR